MSPQGVLLTLVVIAGIGVLGFGISIIHSINQRPKPLVPYGRKDKRKVP